MLTKAAENLHAKSHLCLLNHWEFLKICNSVFKRVYSWKCDKTGYLRKTSITTDLPCLVLRKKNHPTFPVSAHTPFPLCGEWKLQEAEY